MKRAPHDHGFTLVEVLVVIGIIAVIVGLLVPAMASVKAESHSSACLSNLRQLFIGVQTSRAQNNDVLPFAEFLPAATPTGPIGGLPATLEKIIEPKADVWFCPADTAEDTQQVGTSYGYTPGAFMTFYILSESSLNLTLEQNARQAARTISQRFDKGYLHTLPVIADSAEYHTHGNRKPWNGVFINGEARPLRRGDDTLPQP